VDYFYFADRFGPEWKALVLCRQLGDIGIVTYICISICRRSSVRYLDLCSMHRTQHLVHDTQCLLLQIREQYNNTEPKTIEQRQNDVTFLPNAYKATFPPQDDQLFFQGIFSSVKSKCTCLSLQSVQAQRTYTSNNDLSQKDRQIPPAKSASVV